MVLGWALSRIEMGILRMNRLSSFLWTPPFWALIGLAGCASGLYFQKMAGNGMGLWLMGLIFLGCAYVERQEAR
jgi:hypothetical protein